MNPGNKNPNRGPSPSAFLKKNPELSLASICIKICVYAMDFPKIALGDGPKNKHNKHFFFVTYSPSYCHMAHMIWAI